MLFVVIVCDIAVEVGGLGDLLQEAVHDLHQVLLPLVHHVLVQHVLVLHVVPVHVRLVHVLGAARAPSGHASSES